MVHMVSKDELYVSIMFCDKCKFSNSCPSTVHIRGGGKMNLLVCVFCSIGSLIKPEYTQEIP